MNRWLTVLDTVIRTKLEHVDAGLNWMDWKAGNWTLSELLEHLDAVGVSVALEENNERLQ